MRARWPPGPARRIYGPLLAPGRDPLAWFTHLARLYGDIVHFRLMGEDVLLLSHPELIRDVLVANQRNFTKDRALQRAKKLLGEGLLTAEGQTHLRHRRLIQPSFHRDRVAQYGATMVDYASRARERWRDGETIDVGREMTRLTLAIVGKTLFDTDIESRAGDIGASLTRVLESFWITLLPASDAIEWLPVPFIQRARSARRRLDRLIYQLIAERRAAGARGDLLSMLVSAQDEGTSARLSDVEVRDEAMTLLLAGHETTANALAWTWYLLSGAPEAQAALHDEVDRALEDRAPGVDDVERLRVVRQVVTEAMRLYPPAWVLGRRAIEACRIGGYAVPAGTLIFMSPWVVQRDARWFDDPEAFRPARWTATFRDSLPKLAYFPFGGGARSCIGESFAWMELALVVATLAQRWHFALAPGEQVVPQPLITLRPRRGIRMIAHTRRSMRRSGTSHSSATAT